MSFGTAITSAAPPKILQNVRSFIQKVLGVRITQKKTVQDIPIHTHISRGWDHTNSMWQRVIWPELDCNLQPLRGKYTAAWKLDWQGGTAENVLATDPQGSSAGRGAGSSMNQPGTSEVAVCKGKGKEKAK